MEKNRIVRFALFTNVLITGPMAYFSQAAEIDRHPMIGAVIPAVMLYVVTLLLPVYVSKVLTKPKIEKCIIFDDFFPFKIKWPTWMVWGVMINVAVYFGLMVRRWELDKDIVGQSLGVLMNTTWIVLVVSGKMPGWKINAR